MKSQIFVAYWWQIALETRPKKHLKEYHMQLLYIQNLKIANVMTFNTDLIISGLLRTVVVPNCDWVQMKKQ